MAKTIFVQISDKVPFAQVEQIFQGRLVGVFGGSYFYEVPADNLNAENQNKLERDFNVVAQIPA